MLTINVVTVALNEAFCRELARRKQQADTIKEMGRWDEFKDGPMLCWPDGDVRFGDAPPNAEAFIVSVYGKALDSALEPFAERYARPLASSLVAEGLSRGLDAFAPLLISEQPAELDQDEPTRVFTVMARGWRERA